MTMSRLIEEIRKRADSDGDPNEAGPIVLRLDPGAARVHVSLSDQQRDDGAGGFLTYREVRKVLATVERAP